LESLGRSLFHSLTPEKKNKKRNVARTPGSVNHHTLRRRCVEIAWMKHDIWEFLRRADGTYSITHNGKLLFDSIPEKWLATQICEEYGFCGQEYQFICAALDRSGRFTVDLSSSHPFQSSHDE
jgi:hypothetical protein